MTQAETGDAPSTELSMIFEIKHRFTGAVLFSLECGSLKICVEAAVDSDADLSRANLSGANLSGANLSGAYLSDADLSRAADIKPEEIPVIPNIDATILAAIEAGGKLDMSSWHGETGHWCGTTHCRAGWAIHLGGEKGKALQDKVGAQMAGTLIYQASRPGMPVPWFFAPDKKAMADIIKCAAEQTKPGA